MPRRKALDVTGRVVRIGALVRVVGVPRLEGLAPDIRRESEAVFTWLMGRYVRVAEIDAQGLAGVWFSIRDGKYRGRHWVAIEPGLLRVRRPRR